MNRLMFQFVFVLLAIITFLSCSTCSRNRIDTMGLPERDEPTQTEGGRERWSVLDEVGYPVISDTISSRLLKRYCYTVSYNKMTRQPNWVMWELRGEHVMNRKEGVWNDYRVDEELPEEERSTLEDYAHSDYDRGHMCPGGDCNWDDAGRDETFVLSNMCPQHPKLNRGDWKEIENACRKWAQQYGRVFIVCGPIFFKSQEHERIGQNQVPVPEAFFKVVLCVEEGNRKGIGFICRNTEGNRKKDFYVNSIRQVERVMGYRFFPTLCNSIKDAVFDMDDINVW